MGKKCSREVSHVLVLVLLLCLLLPCLSQSVSFLASGRRLLMIGARPSTSGQAPKRNDNYHGRRLLSIYSPNAITGTRPSTSARVPKRNDNYHGKRLLSKYFPNAEIGAGASKSGKGGGRSPEDSPLIPSNIIQAFNQAS